MIISTITLLAFIEMNSFVCSRESDFYIGTSIGGELVSRV